MAHHRGRVISGMLWLLVLHAALAFAQTQDVKGSKDSPQLKRYDGSIIIKYAHKDYDEYTIPLGKTEAPPVGNTQSAAKLSKSMRVEGEVTRLTYKIPLGRSALEVIRNYENELPREGSERLFAAADTDLGPNFSEAAGYAAIQLGIGVPTSPFWFWGGIGPQRYEALKVQRPEGELYVVLYATQADNEVNLRELKSLAGIERGQTVIQVDLIVSKAMESHMVTVQADEMAQKIADTGRIALYGIYFDFNKADLKAESDPTLEQIAQLLRNKPALKLLVVGHTDTVGSFAFNQDLSRRRAIAVANALASKYGIEKNRLTSEGVAFASPVASNMTEAGRAKNRRVELVEY